ncbi:MAG: ATP-binding protein [Acidobacteria bacterium]|nr:ATP-binding protein [Acidobacteriota bacterium]MYA45903.1 ATP-binding protein [Acidobacteriota bacterium]MYI39953.1 ATP-binding protein [Acidobacteriota bacterium]
MIPRKTHGRAVARLLRESPAVLLLGARQVGKTTLAKEIAKSWSRGAHRFDLEDDRDLARLADPFLALEPLRGLVVLDEVQRRPNLFPALRVLADRPRTPARFLLLGSASPALLQQSSETLAGRVAHHELSGFDLSEVGPADADRLWVRGGFPRSFAARSGTSSFRWRDDFVHTFLARDLAALGISIPGATMERFWTMLAHYHGQVWNGSELARAFGVSHHVVRRYLEALESVFMVRSLKPWSANLKKRQVRTPKVYVRDSGLLHRLLDIRTTRELERHPKVGASWEGFVIECVLRALNAAPGSSYFWRTHTGAELDLLVQQGGRLRGFEIKRTTAPRLTRSMRSAMSDLDLSRLDVIHAGSETFPLAAGVRAVSLGRLLDDL